MNAASVGRSLATLALPSLGVEVTAVRRKGSREVNPAPETEVRPGDVLVLLGTPERLARAEIRILQG